MVFSRYTVLVFSMSVRCHLLRISGDMKNLQIASVLSLCLVLTITASSLTTTLCQTTTAAMATEVACFVVSV